MEEGRFSKVGITPENPKWEQCIKRQHDLYKRKEDIRSEFLRDYNRILHCTAYRRLKQKTQVFYATRNDHVCTRIEHVNHVAAVSLTISKYLGLNTELTSAIAIGHDLGHAPFGHTGEEILREIAQSELNDTFWHERNSLRFVDKCETLPDPWGNERNLNLTYAVRDGIICHCGEVNENSVFPRDEAVELEAVQKANQYPPFTWEGCVVKIADKIAYLGRDIEDARRLGILTHSQLGELEEIVESVNWLSECGLNTTVLMQGFIADLCASSSPEKGICFSPESLELLKKLMAFNYKNIYRHKRLTNYRDYAKLIIRSIFDTLRELYHADAGILSERIEECRQDYPLLSKNFRSWLVKYSNFDEEAKRKEKCINETIYMVEKEDEYLRAIIDFISGMTDGFAIRIFNELTSF